jgi:hypothetical protein
MPDQTGLCLDRPTLEHAIAALEKRLEAVATYGAGGCPTCHDAEAPLRDRVPAPLGSALRT